MTVELIQGLLLAFALVVILMPPYIRLLRTAGFVKRIRAEGPESHYVKEGTPTMGGLLVVVVVVAIYFFLKQHPDASTFAPLAALAGVGLLGAFDDYLNARTGEGIRARQKLAWLTVVAFVAAYQIQQTYDITAIAVPFIGAVPIDARLYVLFAAFAIVATANGVNITDGSTGCRAGHRDRVRRVHAHRPPEHAEPGQPRAALRAGRRGAPRLPLVQRPSSAGLHRRFGGVIAGHRAGGHGPHHGPGAGAALIGIIFVASSGSSSWSRPCP